MANGTTTTTAPGPAPKVVETPASVVPVFSDEQFDRLLSTLMFGLAMAGTLAAGKTPTPSIANLRDLTGYAKAVKDMVDGQ